ncbi:MAG TPA: nucleotidyltransferase family protein [Solirubrobacteraceae bacterium]|nr:nucleotidyltransferase family protein [Solirubrobacteraceae bacterium]
MTSPPDPGRKDPAPGPTLGLVLAAGAARRFGSPKQVAFFRGRPLVLWSVHVLRAGGIDRVMLAVGAHQMQVRAAVDRVVTARDIVMVPDWEEGMSASLRAGVQAAAQRGAGAVMVVLADQPLLSDRAVARMLGAADEDRSASVLRAAYADGRPGHPVLLRADTFDQVATLRGDQGARALTGVQIRDVDCASLGSSADVDTPADLLRIDVDPD